MTPVLAVAPGLSALALGAGLAWAFARWYAKPRRRLPRQSPPDYGLPHRPVRFASGTARLHAWLIPQPDGAAAGRPAVVVVHGWSSSKASMLPVAAALHGAGITLLLIDARGHGASDAAGPITIRKFAQDIGAAADYLEAELGGRIGRLGVLGHSLGGSSAILAASLDHRIRCVVSSSAFADPTRLTREVMAALHLPRGLFLWAVCRFLERWLGVPMAEVAPERRIGLVDAPVLLLHGDRDRYIPPSNMDAIHAGARNGNVQRLLLRGCDHADVLNDPRYHQHAAGFFSEHLASGGTGGEPAASLEGP